MLQRRPERALRLHDQFADLACRAAATVAGGHPVRVLLGQCVRILHRDREPDSGHHRQIYVIVAYVRNLLIVDTGDLIELLLSRQFLAFSLVDTLDPEAGHADAHHL